MTQVQGHLESVKEELHQTREDLQQSKEKLIEKEDSFRKRMLESDAEIESSKKTIAELQVGFHEVRNVKNNERGRMTEGR